ncbi:DNA cytosine methyltransferase [Oryzomonas japonica]|uniref:Cytosine-specific methyltransferase n=1 Tax=Oryzomonas japonica TaxID=2603858 RepID=A0A7J4ZR85_9BACT|nr:DNA cytosine methyltransferase [Oryzomonas japonica]KAB0665694.1 DNA cytosine methyltransferase [Oryzomonas japonica]
MSSLAERIKYTSSAKVPTCLDLFSGAGGISIGFAMAGGRPLGAVDFDKDSIDTYSRLFPDAIDVACCDIEQWRPKSSPSEVDVIIGGPPCQGFSLARGLRFVDDPRNHLYKHFVSMVAYYKPTWFVMENVEGIINIGNGVILKQIHEDFATAGYSFDYKVVNMAEYGVPQLRRRAVFVGNNLNKTFKWPEPCFYDKKKATTQQNLFNNDLKPFNSVNSVLSDLLLPQGNYFAHRANSQMRGPRNRDAHTEPAFTLRVRGDEFALCELPATSAFIPGPIPEEEVKFRKPQNELQECLRNIIPPWIQKSKVANSRQTTLPELKGTRRLTIREQARLQTFPDWVSFEGKITSQARQIGNAVPPLFAFHLFNEIFSHM